MNIIGISAYYHDSAAALLIDGKIAAAAQEERFSRIKFDYGFPEKSIRFCLESNHLKLSDIDAVVFYDKPFIKFERLLETYFSYAPQGLVSFLKSMPVWLKQKLFLKSVLKKQLASHFGLAEKQLPQLYFCEHHESHAASAFYPSPFGNAAVLCLDGVGEWSTSTAWHGNGNQLDQLWEIKFPHSLGLLYSAFTYFTGFKVNSGEYKLMGLAPYGVPKYANIIKEHLLDIKSDGSFRLNMEYFSYATGLRMTNGKFSRLFGIQRRKPETDLNQTHMDIASSIQQVTEDIVLRLANTVYKETGKENLCMAGGVALNCVSNGNLLRKGPFKNIWIQPAAGDSGGAIGAALRYWYGYHHKPRKTNQQDAMQGSYLGPAFTPRQIKKQLESTKAVFTELDEGDLYHQVATLLADKKVIGWFQDRMEFGPRALGNRSILGDPRGSDTQAVVNLKIKYRESFRPFAPSILADKVQDYFELAVESPYMLLVAPVKEHLRLPVPDAKKALFGIDMLNVPRSSIPAVTHVDYSARVQTVSESGNRKYYQLIKAFFAITNCPVVLNTSFNVRGEPVVCTPFDAYQCFMRTEMDYLVVGNFIFDKQKQPPWHEQKYWQEEFELD